MPYVCSETGKANVPKMIRTSGKQDYLTGWAALNRTDPEWPSSGDWHHPAGGGRTMRPDPWVHCATVSGKRFLDRALALETRQKPLG